MRKKSLFPFLLLLALGGLGFAQEAAPSLNHEMANLVVQLGLLLFVAKLGGILSQKLGFPSVLGELLSGVLIGPFALGGIACPGFPHGLFPISASGFAVSPELYGFATVASIILLFVSGLETDLSLFLRYSVTGGVVGLGGVIASFAAGLIASKALLGSGWFDPSALFMGILSTATSVGITARILSDQKKMDSPEGVTILSAAVIDDVLGIICLAVVMGIVGVMSGGDSQLGWEKILSIAAKAIGIWLGFTVLGIVFSRQIARFLKVFKSPGLFSILAFGLSLLLAGFFEMEGLAMIIGAYIVGLSLSKSDIAHVIREKTHTLYEFFVPIFFAVMGMLVNPRLMIDPSVLSFGALFTLLAILAKVLGCGLPALALGFNGRGSLRIGLGMIPRGEVALIIAGIGLSSSILDQRVFGVTVMMILATTLLAPPLLSLSLKLPGRGTRKESRGTETATTIFGLPDRDATEILLDGLYRELQAEGFWVQALNVADGLFQARKGNVSLSITASQDGLSVESASEDVNFVRSVVRETLIKMQDEFSHMLEAAQSDAKNLPGRLSKGRISPEVIKHLKTAVLIPAIKANQKEAIIKELVGALAKAKAITDETQVYADVMTRERRLSTGLQKGLALPHGKSEGAQQLQVAVGIKREGVDFDSLDGQASKLFILVVSPKRESGPHIELLSAIGSLLCEDEARLSLIDSHGESGLRKAIWKLCGR